MKLGIMQPYLFPYLGYWQLMNYVDTYVICDDVSFIKNGWINRNNIKINGEAKRLGIKVKKASQNKHINELEILLDEKEKTTILKTLEVAYKKAPYFNEVYNLVKQILDCNLTNLSEFLIFQIRVIAKYLKINTQFKISSQIEGKDNSLKCQDMVINICKCLNADTYVNAIGGQSLYFQDIFKNNGLDLYFLQMDDDIVYPQGKTDFIQSLSIIDVMMYNSVEEIQNLLSRFKLI